MNRKCTFSIVVAIFMFTPPVFAHGPFDSSTRAILNEATVEIALTVGMDGGKALLAGAPPEAFRVRSVGPSYELSKEFAARFYEVSSGDAVLSPDKVEVRTDGLEFDVVLNFARPAGNALAVRAVFLDQLPSDFNSSFLMTDEVGNIFATKVLSRRNESVGLTLPPAVTTEAAGAATTPSAPMTTPVMTAPAMSSVASAQPVSEARLATTVAAGDKFATTDTPPGRESILTGHGKWLFLGGLLVVVLGGFWLVQRVFSGR